MPQFPIHHHHPPPPHQSKHWVKRNSVFINIHDEVIEPKPVKAEDENVALLRCE